MNRENIIKKFTIADNVTINGKHILGKLNFFNNPALSIKIFVQRVTISANRPQVIIPTHK